MTGDNFDKEDYSNQEHTKKEYLFMYSMIEEIEIEPFLNDSKRQRNIPRCTYAISNFSNAIGCKR